MTVKGSCCGNCSFVSRSGSSLILEAGTMFALSKDHERLLEKLLRLAGSSGLLEEALISVRMERGDRATLDDVVKYIHERRTQYFAQHPPCCSEKASVGP